MFLTLGSTVAHHGRHRFERSVPWAGYSNGWAGMLYGLGGAQWAFYWSRGYLRRVRKFRFMTMSGRVSYLIPVAVKIIKTR